MSSLVFNVIATVFALLLIASIVVPVTLVFTIQKDVHTTTTATTTTTTIGTTTAIATTTTTTTTTSSSTTTPPVPTCNDPPDVCNETICSLPTGDICSTPGNQYMCLSGSAAAGAPPFPCNSGASFWPMTPSSCTACCDVALCQPPPASWTFYLTDNTQLTTSLMASSLGFTDYAICVSGFALFNNGLTLQVLQQESASFVTLPSEAGTGIVPVINIVDMPSFIVNDTLIGARVYYAYMANTTSCTPYLTYTFNDTTGVFAVVEQPLCYDHPLGFFEVTAARATPIASLRLTVDLQTVDAFTIPASFRIDDENHDYIEELGNPNTTSRSMIIEAYRTAFSLSPYGALALEGCNNATKETNFFGQCAMLLNPGHHVPAPLLSSWDETLIAIYNLTVPLSIIGDDALVYTSNNITCMETRCSRAVNGCDSVFMESGSNVLELFNPLCAPSPLDATSAALQVFANNGVYATTMGIDSCVTDVLLDGCVHVIQGLQRDLVIALIRGVALQDYTTAWQNQSAWYPLGEMQSDFAHFFHSTDGLFLLPPGAVTNARGELMSATYSASYDENPVHPTGPNPTVPSKIDPLPLNARYVNITFQQWGDANVGCSGGSQITSICSAC